MMNRLVLVLLFFGSTASAFLRHIARFPSAPKPLQQATTSSATTRDEFNPLTRSSFEDLTASLEGIGSNDGYALLDEECVPSDNDEEDDSNDHCLPQALVALPSHSHEGVREILQQTERTLKALHKHSRKVEMTKVQAAKEAGRTHEQVYANNYVDLGKIDVVGFDYDYTLVTYKEELLELIYEHALNRLVKNRQYPAEMLESGLRYDPFFSIRGLAVDKETGWLTHLSYTHKVAVAWEGREKIPTSRIFEEYRGKRALQPAERKKRLKPLNDLFSLAESCLLVDTIQFFKDRGIRYCAPSVVTDVLNAVTQAHVSGDFHRLVANEPERFFDPTPHLQQVLRTLKDSGKRLIFVSNSPFWYVDAGMRHVLGENWREEWDVIVTSAGKPSFYTDENRPFREICLDTGRIMFKPVEKFESGTVYTEGCLKELTRLIDWEPRSPNGTRQSFKMRSGSHEVAANVLYIGDSLFADLVDAKREFGWTTAAVTPEVGYELEVQNQPDFMLAQRSIDLLLSALRVIQEELGTSMRTEEDIHVLDSLERLVSLWRDRETHLLGNPFGSIFRARYQPSLFAHSLRRYSDLYMTSVSSLRHYSPQHRFYPERNHKLLAHEITAGTECWTLDDILQRNADSNKPQFP